MKGTSPAVFRTVLPALVGLLLLGLSSVQGATILIALGSGAGANVLGVNPNPDTTDTAGAGYWNNIQAIPGGAVALNDNTGNSSGISATFAGFTQSSNNGYNGNALSGLYPFGAYASFYYIASTTSATLTLSGLDGSGNTSYSFTFLSARAGVGTGQRTTASFTFAGANSGVVGPVDAGTADQLGNPTLYTVTNIIPTLGGVITLTDLAGTPVGGVINFLKIDTFTVIPEPSTTALLALGTVGLVMLGIHRRRQARA